MAIRRVIAVLAVAASPAAAAVAAADADLQAGVQSAMLLEAVLPKHGPRPSKELEDEMQQAGTLVYKAYGLLQTAAQGMEEAQERLKTKLNTQVVGAEFASGEALLQQGSGMLRKGQRLQRDAESRLQSTADPLGSPPEPPQEWANVGAMARRAGSKERMLRNTVAELRGAARSAGVSLLATGSASKAAPAEDSVQKQEDDKLISLISSY
mmetsp:Transcript_42818/g.136067  ORF Transcript_42818/g.136067 Transcript_42818/m.136067 type:complete len:210 (+) Transcript_42818:89-718(+)